MFQFDSALPENEIARDEELDGRNPLRHLMDDSELEGVIASEGLARPSGSLSELLTVLPQQSQSIQDGLLTLSFAHIWGSLPHPISISLVVDASPGCGGLAWPAGQILASYLVQRGPEYIRDKNVLELGSGTGLVGLVVGALGNAKTWITDQAHFFMEYISPLLPIMEKNVRLNRLEDKVFVAELNWGSPIPSDIPRPDIILAADCVYFEPAFPLLVQTFNDLSDSKNDMFFCYKKRRKADKRFLGMLKKHFTWKEVMDDPNRQIYNREAITLIQLFKLNSTKPTF